MSKKNEMSPEDKLLKAIWGDKYKTEAEVEAEIEEAVSNVSDEDFKKQWGVSIEEHTNQMMLFAGWADSVSAWEREHGQERKYHVGDFESRFSFRQVVDMVQTFYRQGQEDGKNGVAEYDRLWTINKR